MSLLSAARLARPSRTLLLSTASSLPSARLLPTSPLSPALPPSSLRAAGFARAAPSSIAVFDKAVKSAQRRRAALSPDYASYHYLRDEVASRLVERLLDINKSFPVTVEFGCGSGAHVSRLLGQVAAEDEIKRIDAEKRMTVEQHNRDHPENPLPPPTLSVPGRGAIGTLHLCDSSPEALQRTKEYWSAHAVDIPPGRKHHYHVLDEEGELPFAPASVDLIVSSMSMHWINDLPGFLKQCKRMLKPDGVFLAAIMGGATLQELRSAFTVADMERLGGVHAHVSPFAYGRDCGDLLATAGFNMPTIDTDVLTVRYPDLFTFMDHLQGMGEDNCVFQRPKAVPRDVFLAAAAAYESLYADDDGLLPATFQVFYLIGWAPDVSQPKPKERGSATAKLGDIDKIVKQHTQTQSSKQQTQQAEQTTSPEEGSKFVE